MLIECDPSIKSIIVNIDAANHDYIIEDLDDQHVVVKENMVAALKRQLDDVGSTIDEQSPTLRCTLLHIHAYLRQPADDLPTEIEGDATARRKFRL